MGNWNDIHDQIAKTTLECQTALNAVIDRIRREHLKALADYTGRNTIAYYSGFLSKPRIEGIDILDDDKNAFMNCVHGLDRSKGLDLILHTPGGNIAATESIANYLRQVFGRDLRAIIPQIAMSAGTMLACACKTIVMGKQSNLGPIDPHINGIPADVVVSEFKRAFQEIQADPVKAHVWSPILSRYSPSFLTQCEYAIDWSRDFVRECLKNNMFADQADAETLAAKTVADLSTASLHKTHSKHLHYDECEHAGLQLERLEDDQTLQNLVLTVHHCFMHTLSNTPTVKIVENQEGRLMARQMPIQMPQLAFGLSGPPQAGSVPSNF